VSKQLVQYVGGALALLVGCRALYLEIVSDGNDPTVMRWFGAALGIAVLTALAAWLIGRSPPS
jgi:hypothetical protein